VDDIKTVFPFIFTEIVKVRSVLFQNGDKQPLELPPPQGPTITLTEKVYVPVKDHPEVQLNIVIGK